jgi:hypothetical protein
MVWTKSTGKIIFIVLSRLCVVTAVYSIDSIPVVINPTLVNASTEATSSILLACSCSTAVMSTTTVVWRKNLIEITARELQANSSRYSATRNINGQSANFIIRNPQPEDTGAYDCKVSVNGTSIASSTAQITVADTVLTCGYEVVRDLDVEVQCPVKESVPLTFPVFWFKNGAEVLSGKERQHSNSRYLKITRAEYSDSGVYQCVALTADGIKNTQLKLTVQGPPEAPLQLSLASQSFHQDCSLVQWKSPNFDGNSPIKSYNLTCTNHYSGHTLTAGCGSDQTRMTVSGLQIGVQYECTLQAINDMGCSNRSNVVSVFCPTTQATEVLMITMTTSDAISSTQCLTAVVVTLAISLICLTILFVDSLSFPTDWQLRC